MLQIANLAKQDYATSSLKRVTDIANSSGVSVISTRHVRNIVRMEIGGKLRSLLKLRS